MRKFTVFSMAVFIAAAVAMAQDAARVASYEKVLDSCRTYTVKGDRCAETMFDLGILYYDMKNLPGALEMYKRIVEFYPLHPKVPHAIFRTGTLYYRAGELDSAKIMFEKFIQRYPTSSLKVKSFVHLNLALIYVNKDIKKAEEHLKNVKRDQVSVTDWECVNEGIACLKRDAVDEVFAKELQANWATEKAKWDATKAERNSVKAEQAAVKAERDAMRADQPAAYAAATTVPIGAGYDKLPWGASIKEAHRLYALTDEEHMGDDGRIFGQKNVGGGISSRMFGFYQDKLFLVFVYYNPMASSDAKLLVEKITSLYGQPNHNKATNEITWKRQKTKVVFKENEEYTRRTAMVNDMVKNIARNSAAIDREQEIRRNQGYVSNADRETIKQDSKASSDVVGWIFSTDDKAYIVEYSDFAALEKVQKSYAEQEKKKEEEKKKKRSDALGL